MTLSIQEIPDRMEITILLTDYAEAIDSMNIDALDGVFTKDALIDHTAFGGIKGALEEMKVFFKRDIAFVCRHAAYDRQYID